MPEIRAIAFDRGTLKLLDQTRLPLETITLEMVDYRDAIRAIKEMKVRGAPALGVTAAYAVVMAASEIEAGGRNAFLEKLAQAGKEIEAARPTAVNMSWAVRRMLRSAGEEPDVGTARERLLSEAHAIYEEDVLVNRRIGEWGSDLVPDGGAVMTHCNAGALATAGYGTALGVIRAAWEQGKRFHVFATETRPFLQGARLTAWELVQMGVPATLLVDSAAGQLLRTGEVGCVVVGADRVAANGDVANKIGTYTLAVLARENGVPFYVAAPTSTVDLGVPTGDEIPIEERSAEEVTYYRGLQTAPEGIAVRNPAFDVTPHRYVSGIVTESGVVREPYAEGLFRVAGTDRESRHG